MIAGVGFQMSGHSTIACAWFEHVQSRHQSRVVFAKIKSDIVVQYHNVHSN